MGVVNFYKVVGMPILAEIFDLGYINCQAEVAELADAHDSKSCSFGSVGSIPTFGTDWLRPSSFFNLGYPKRRIRWR